MPHPSQLIVPPSYQGVSRSGSPSGSERKTGQDISRPSTPGGSFGESNLDATQAQPIATVQGQEEKKGKAEQMTSSLSQYSHKDGPKYTRNEDAGQSQAHGSEFGVLDYLATMGRATQAVLTLAVVPTIYVVAKDHSRLKSLEADKQLRDGAAAAARRRLEAETASAAGAASTVGGIELLERSGGQSSTAGNTSTRQ